MASLVNTNLQRPAIQHETDKALLVRVPGGLTGFHDKQVWVPKSQVQWIAAGPFHESMHVPAWLARKIFDAR